MSRVTKASPAAPSRTRRACLGLILTGTTALIGACSGLPFGGNGGPVAAGPPQEPSAIGKGRVKVGLILPLSAAGNVGAAALSMRNAGEMALAEFHNPDIQLLVKDDGASTYGAQQAAQQALDEGAEIILGPLFAQSVASVGQVARGRGVPVIAFSTDTSVAARGVYLLSFLPESDVERIISYSASGGKRAIAALIPDNAYGSVVEGAFKQTAARRSVRITGLEHYQLDKARMRNPLVMISTALLNSDALFIPDGAEGVSAVVAALNTIGAKRLQLLGTGLWDDPRVFADLNLQGGLYAAPDGVGFRGFAKRYRTKYGQDPVRTATLAYDAVALVAALVKTQGQQRFSEPVLTNPSGFAGIDGVFRFRPDGTNERGLAILRVTQEGGQVVVPAPRVFAGSAM